MLCDIDFCIKVNLLSDQNVSIKALYAQILFLNIFLITMSTPVFHNLPVLSSSPAQRGVKKSSADSQADFNSVVFLVPIESFNAMNSTSVASSLEIVSAAAVTPEDMPKVLPTGSPILHNGNRVYSIASTMSPATANSVNITASSPVSRSISILSNSPVLNSSPATAVSPIIPSRAVLSPKVNGAALNTSPAVKHVATKLQVKRLAENAVATLVFFDLETTGLAHEIGKHNVQITEISMIAMNRKEFQKSSSSELKDIRLIQKVCLCTRPRARVSAGAAKVTGLNDGNLIDQEPFDQNAASVIITFLSHLPKPVCLLAHNGNAYDYPLIKAEFNRLSIHLSSDILIADTLKAFRALGVPVLPPGKKIPKSVKYGRQGQMSYALDNLHLYLFGKKPVGSHSSEGDCIALAKVCHRVKDLMLPWIEENCSTLDTVSPMW